MRLIALRRSEPALRDGAMALVDGIPPDVLAWTRTTTAGKTVLVAINMGATPETLTLPAGARPQTLAATDAETIAPKTLTLPPFATWIGQL